MSKIVFMGTPEFSVPALETLARASEHEVVAVYAQPDRPVGRGLRLTPPPVKARALELGLPVFQPERLTLPGELDRLKGFDADFFVVVAYGQILKQEALDVPKIAPVNIHASLLPRWRGAAPIQWSLLSGDAETGVTTMRMVKALDAGEMYLKSSAPISDTDTSQSLHDRLSKMGAELILPTLEGLAAGTLKGKPQDESRMTLAPKLAKEFERLDPRQDARALERRVRALNPWPGTSLEVASASGTARLKIRQARLANFESAKADSGLFLDGDRLILGCEGGGLEVLKVQQEGKPAVDAQAFVSGWKGRGQTFPIQLKSGA